KKYSHYHTQHPALVTPSHSIHFAPVCPQYTCNKGSKSHYFHYYLPIIMEAVGAVCGKQYFQPAKRKHNT
ncbi:hypothetical protein, partial [Pseudodesulfovibrio pelocollis]|uniref:hypothetical protein n=1 Tax=Pseudodesulfovibrio pelocollis TaxID=3051432 RepID=UPI00255A87EA